MQRVQRWHLASSTVPVRTGSCGQLSMHFMQSVQPDSGKSLCAAGVHGQSVRMALMMSRGPKRG